MNAIKLLRQAQKADQLGNYKLADKLFNQAYRFAAGERAIEEAIVKALEEAGIRSGEAIATDAIKAALEKAIADAAAGEKATLESMLREVGAPEDEIAKMVEEAATKGIESAEKDGLVAKLSESLNGPTGIARRMAIPVPPKPSLVDRGKEMFGKLSEKYQAMVANPKNMKRLKALGWTVGLSAAGVGGIQVWRAYMPNGKEGSDQDVDNALNNDPYKDMYKRRMDAGQQQGQDVAAQKWVNENKDKFKTQRDLYNAALGAGDENFANDVIAIIKRDAPTMDIGPRS